MEVFGKEPNPNKFNAWGPAGGHYNVKGYRNSQKIFINLFKNLKKKLIVQ